jgi:hypothetical protein
MGLLDDAIREHLDLKRRRGADPTEIERAEREALGPVRRGPDEQEQLNGAAEEDIGYDGDEAWDEPFDDELGESEPHGAGSAGIETADRVQPDAQDRLGGEESIAGDESHGATPPPHPASADPSGQLAEETVEYEVEAALAEEDEKGTAADPSPERADPETGRGETSRPARSAAARSAEGEEDMLEETPEFLQDTPDHDRLWFEQRPPRDFDFEG